MAIKQLSILVPNKKGTLAEITGVLKKHEVDLRAISVYDTPEYGIMRIVVNEPAKATMALHEAGFISKTTDVLAIDPEDKPGSLNKIFTIMDENSINVDYIYSFLAQKGEDQYFVLKVEDIQQAQNILVKNGIKIIKNL